jgi:uncharacterized protein (DUF1330 family)
MSAYLVVNYDVTDPNGYEEYQSGAAPIMTGGKLLALDADSTALEGEPGRQTVLVEYPTREAALAAYESEEYQAVVGKRLAATANGRAVIVNGLGG